MIKIEIKSNKKLYEKIKKLTKYSDTDIAIILDCGRNTVVKIKTDEKCIFSNKRILYLLENFDKLTKENLSYFIALKKVVKDYEVLIFNGNSEESLNEFKHFLAGFSFIREFIENTKGYKRNIFKVFHQHMRNFNMRCNPYYMVMRTFLDKELRPFVDFNIDFQKERVIDLKFTSFSTARFNSLGIKDRYNLEYSERIKDIINLIKNSPNINCNLDKFSDRFRKELKSITFSRRDLNLESIKYNDFIKLLYLFSISYSDQFTVEITMYEDSSLNKFNYIKSKILKSECKKYGKINIYNFARFFNIDNNYLLLENVLFNYQFHKIEGLERKEYKGRLYKNVEFRMTQIQKLIIMVSGLNYKENDRYDFVFEKDPNIGGNSDNYSLEERIKEIQNIERRSDDR